MTKLYVCLRCKGTHTHTVLRGRDPSAVAVLLEDSAAVGGVFLAGSALLLAHLTGNTMYDAIGSISIGGVCVCVCVYLGYAVLVIT